MYESNGYVSNVAWLVVLLAFVIIGLTFFGSMWLFASTSSTPPVTSEVLNNSSDYITQPTPAPILVPPPAPMAPVNPPNTPQTTSPSPTPLNTLSASFNESGVTSIKA